MTQETVIFYNFLTVIEVNRSISSGILSMLSETYNNILSLSVAKTSGFGSAVAGYGVLTQYTTDFDSFVPSKHFDPN